MMMRPGMCSCNPSVLRETTVEVPNVKWEDIGGYDEVKQMLIQTIMYPITYPDIYLKYGQRPSRVRLYFWFLVCVSSSFLVGCGV